jgi:hypothetical protein
MVDTHEILLFDILQELKKLNEPVKDKSICKYCGGTHDNKGQAMNCAKKNKK